MNKVFEYQIVTRSRTELINIDLLVQKAIESSGLKDGVCQVF